MERAPFAVYVLWTGSPNAADANVYVRGVYGDAADAAAACSALINQGSPAQMSGVMISTPGKIRVDGSVWLYNGTGSATFTAFGDMDAAEARRKMLGGQVRAFEVIGLAGKKAYYGGDLRKKALDAMPPGGAEELYRRAPAEAKRVAHELVKLAQKQPFGVAQFYRR